jgi:hypothetical protein
MTNFTELQDGLVMALGSGIDASDVRVKYRYCREGGLFQASSRKKGFPQTEAVHAAVALLAAIAGGAQTGIVDRVRNLWHLPRFPHLVSRPSHGGGGLAYSLAQLQPGGLKVRGGWLDGTLGEVIGGFIDLISDEIEGGYFDPQVFLKKRGDITLSHNGGFAAIAGGHEDEGQTDDLWFRSNNFMFNGGALSVTIVSPRTLIRLAHLVVASRQEAKRRGIEIPVEETYRALGVDHQPSPSPKPNLNKDEASRDAGPASGDVPTNDERQEDGNQPSPMPSTDRLPAFTIGKGTRRDDAREDSAHRIAA